MFGFDINPVRAFFSKYLIVGLLITIAAGSAYYVITTISFKSQIDSKDKTIGVLNNKLGTLTSENTALISTNTQFKTVSDAQNTALTGILDVISRTQKKTYEDLQKAKLDNEKYKTAYQSIFNRPSTPENPCKSLDSRLDDYLGQRIMEKGK